MDFILTDDLHVLRNVDQHCQFTHTQFREAGRWYGVCAHGMASGRGYGLIVNGRGDTLEFIGDADKGVASGFGGMIIQQNRQVGATYYEGEFKNGIPDGVVRVEKAGQTPKLRKFKAGVDVGKGSAASLQSLTFSSVSRERGVSSP